MIARTLLVFGIAFILFSVVLVGEEGKTEQ